MSRPIYKEEGGGLMSDAIIRHRSKANRAVAMIMTTTVLGILVWLVLGDYNVRFTDVSYYYMLASSSVMIICLLAYLLFKDRWWTGYMMICSMMIGVFLIVAGVNYNRMIMMAIPVITSMMYYSRKFTVTAMIAGSMLMLVGLIINDWYAPITYGFYPGMPYFDRVFGIIKNYYLVNLVIYLLICQVALYSATNGLEELKREEGLIMEKAMMEKDANNAKQIQEGLLKDDFPCRDYCSIATEFSAAKYVGGDFYDCFKVGDDQIAVVMADVSGKGLPAAMFMAAAMTLIRSNVQKDVDLAKAMEKANRELAASNPLKYFVTVWIGILDLHTGDLTYIDAGHNLPFVRKGGEYIVLQSKPDFIFGRKKNIRFNKQYATLDVGDRLYLYTDGVTEAVGPDGTMFGEDRLRISLNSCSDATVNDTIKAVSGDLAGFVRDTPQSDDITMMCIEYTRRLDRVTDPGITVPADSSGHAQMMERLQKVLAEAGCNSWTVSEMQTVCSEVFANIDMYAYGEGKGDVLVTMDVLDRLIRIRFIDKGIPFNPLDHADPDPRVNFAERKQGGLGIMIVKRVCDDVFYTREGDKNVLTLEKEI